MKFYPLALLAMLLAASTATAGDHYNYQNSLANCGCQAHSWKNGCCDREPSCCNHLWDGYGCNQRCCGLHLPQINWNSMHANAAPYQVPCIRMPHICLPKIQLPKIHLPKPCFSHDCADSCTEAPACEQGCTSCASNVRECPCGTPVLDWVKSHFQQRSCDCPCDSGCAGGQLSSGKAGMNYGTEAGTMIYQDVPQNAVPTEVAPQEDVEMPPAPKIESRDKKNNKKKKNRKDNKSASLQLFPALTF